MISVNNVTLTRNNQALLKNVSFTAPKGSVTVLIGKSGAGKTTLLKCIVSVLSDFQGEITLNGTEIASFSNTERTSRIGFVSQDGDLFPFMTVLQNCIDPLIIRGLSAKEAEQKAREKLASLDIEAFADRYPSQLSGGQRQRVALARMLCLEPEVLVFDEPTAALDPENTDVFSNVITTLCKAGMTVILSSQDTSFICTIADRMYLMDTGEIVETFDKDTNPKIGNRISNFFKKEQSCT